MRRALSMIRIWRPRPLIVFECSVVGGHRLPVSTLPELRAVPAPTDRLPRGMTGRFHDGMDTCTNNPRSVLLQVAWTMMSFNWLRDSIR